MPTTWKSSKTKDRSATPSRTSRRSKLFSAVTGIFSSRSPSPASRLLPNDVRASSQAINITNSLEDTGEQQYVPSSRQSTGVRSPHPHEPEKDKSYITPQDNPSQTSGRIWDVDSSTMGPDTLNPTTNDILERCSRFRILLVGKSGVGKSELINHTFGVDKATVSHKDSGVCDINEEITSQHNPRFVLHDSQGFEANEIENLKRVKDFIQSRSGDAVDLKDRVHAVWLCIQIPFSGGRVFETGDEEFLRFVTNVPIIIVFTQFDKLVSRMEENLTNREMQMSEKEISTLCLQKADAEFKTLCLDPLHKLNSKLEYAKTSVKPAYRPTLTNLINLTQTLVEHQVEGDIWIVSAMAQRASAQAKIDSSIAVGMKRKCLFLMGATTADTASRVFITEYWQGLASSTNFSGSVLRQCLYTIHVDITSSWNFYDPDNLLNSEDFQNKIMTLAQLVTPDASEVNSWFRNLEPIQGIVGLVSTAVPVLAPAIAAIGLSAMFIKWITTVYQKTPEALRCLMGYIVDLTLVMDQLFLNTLSLKPPRRITMKEIDDALEGYKDSEAIKVHRAIREYANKTTFMQILQANNAQETVIDLIRDHRVGAA